MSKRHYIASTPPSINPHISPFFSKFYEISDNPSSDEEYARSFTDDATVIMGRKKVEGYADILRFRQSLWSGPVVTRKHTINKIFPFGALPFRADSNDVMLHGKVEYGLKNGKEVTVEWAGRAVLVEDKEEKGTWRMGVYQVYLDAGAVVEAMKE